MRKIRFLILCVALGVLACQNNSTEKNEVAEVKADEKNHLKDDLRLAWFHQAKFGMFIHWGIYSVPAGDCPETDNEGNVGEWIMYKAGMSSEDYEKFAGNFNPVDFDAKEWVKIAKDAGMKYMVVTAKHHDGFCMYDSKYTEYDIVDATPFNRDPLKELSEACHETGIKFCVYYSLVDWHHPEFPQQYSQSNHTHPEGFHGNPNPDADINKYAEYMNNQLEELLTNYGDIGIVWFDKGGSFMAYDMSEVFDNQKTVDLIHQLQPNCLINNRLDAGADYGTPEQHIPEDAQKTAFEVCMTLNDHWGFVSGDNNWKSSKQLIQNLSDIAGKGGNFLLNVGPTSKGKIPDTSVKILSEMGKWMETNGVSIYGTQAFPYKTQCWSANITYKPGQMFLHPYRFQTSTWLHIRGTHNLKPLKAYLLENSAETLTIEEYSNSWMVKLPENIKDLYKPVIKIEIREKDE